ncbi:MAG: hypothetical protein J6X05_08275 [Bacteroidales bacterium]|nr:hypothetical protein [Bacteroidales bacterium]
MAEIFDNMVANDVATKKKYVKPEIEAIPLAKQPQLLAGSDGIFGAKFGYDEEEI